MANYILLVRLSDEGRDQVIEDPDHLLKAANATRVAGVQCLGLYGVLGRYDFVCILDATDNEAAARYSLKLGATANVMIETLPAVPISHLRSLDDQVPGRTPERLGLGGP